MKKFLFSLIGMVLTTGFVGVTNAAVDVSDLFNGETPLVDDAYQKLLTDYDNTRGYSNTTITPDVTCSNVGEIEIYSVNIQDSYYEDASQYILVVSPYSMDKIRRGDSSIDYSKIIMKRNFVGNAPEGAVLDSIYFSISLDEIDLDSKYYGFIVPVDIYDEIGKPSNELELDMSNCFGTISIANPDNLSEGITILDRNLGATSNDITDGGSYGYYYQRGNNYGFNRYYPVNTTENFVEWNERYNNKGYYGEEFVKSYGCFTDENGNDGCYSARDYWNGESHDGLRGGANDNTSNGWGANETNYVDRQGPCPEGYHVPSAGEWGLLVKYWQKTYGNTTILSGGNGEYNFVGNAERQSFMNYFKLPLAGAMDSLDASMTELGNEGMYWSSTVGSANRGYARHLLIYSDNNPTSVFATAESPRIEGYSVRCFKNTYESEVKSTKITLKPGLNTFSTPAVLKSISFSNGGENISFAKMENGKWKALAINGGTFDKVIRPLEGFIIRNSNSEDVIMTIEYDTAVNEVPQKKLDAGWNFLGITTTTNPFANIFNAMAMDIIDFTSGRTNKIDFSKFSGPEFFALGKAYGVFVDNSNGIYRGENSVGSGANPGNTTFNIVDNTEEDTVYLTENNSVWASFRLKPTDRNGGYLDTITFRTWNAFSCNDIILRVDGTEYECSNGRSGTDLFYEIDETVSSIGVPVEIILKGAHVGEHMIGIMSVNNQYNYEDGGLPIPLKTFTKRFEPALVYIKSQQNMGDYTEYTLGVDKIYDGDVIPTLRLYTGYDSQLNRCTGLLSYDAIVPSSQDFEDGTDLTIMNENDTQFIGCIEYLVAYETQSCEVRDEDHNCTHYMPSMTIRSNVTINNMRYPDYFKVDGENRKVFASNNGGNVVPNCTLIDDLNIQHTVNFDNNTITLTWSPDQEIQIGVIDPPLTLENYENGQMNMGFDNASGTFVYDGPLRQGDYIFVLTDDFMNCQNERYYTVTIDSLPNNGD